MWINNRISRPLRHDKYKTLVDFDGLGNLIEYDGELFDGYEWDVYNSSSQFICYWWASKEDYETIANHLEKEQEKYLIEMEETSKNFGGL